MEKQASLSDVSFALSCTATAIALTALASSPCLKKSYSSADHRHLCIVLAILEIGTLHTHTFGTVDSDRANRDCRSLPESSQVHPWIDNTMHILVLLGSGLIDHIYC